MLMNSRVYICARMYTYVYIVFRKLNNTMERILKYVQNNHGRRRTEKPACLPISTEVAILNFESANEDTYEQVVR